MADPLGGTRVSDRTCAFCSSPYVSASRLRMYCTDRCRWRARKPGARATQPCRICAEPMPVFPGRSLPSGQAAHQACRRQLLGYRNTRAALSPTQSWTCGRCGTLCSRERVRGQLPKLCPDCRPRYKVAVPKSVRFGIYERDGWRCGICRETVDASLAGTSSLWRPTLDHIVPHSVGGSVEPGNLRLAHQWCNAARGAGRYDDEDFRHAV